MGIFLAALGIFLAALGNFLAALGILLATLCFPDVFFRFFILEISVVVAGRKVKNCYSPVQYAHWVLFLISDKV